MGRVEQSRRTGSCLITAIINMQMSEQFSLSLFRWMEKRGSIHHTTTCLLRWRAPVRLFHLHVSSMISKWTLPIGRKPVTVSFLPGNINGWCYRSKNSISTEHSCSTYTEVPAYYGQRLMRTSRLSGQNPLNRLDPTPFNPDNDFYSGQKCSDRRIRIKRGPLYMLCTGCPKIH